MGVHDGWDAGDVGERRVVFGGVIVQLVDRCGGAGERGLPGGGIGRADRGDSSDPLCWRHQISPEVPRRRGRSPSANFVIDRTGVTWICTTAGTPGSWTGSLVGLAPSGDTTGATDTSNIQGLLNLGVKAVLQAGLFWTNQTLQFPSGSALAGAGMGISTIRVKSSFAATQVGSNPGMVMLAGPETAPRVTSRSRI